MSAAFAELIAADVRLDDRRTLGQTLASTWDGLVAGRTLAVQFSPRRAG